MGRVAVVGSANVDHVIRVPHLPGPGETVLGSSYAMHMGGKGANQAVAAARLGAGVDFIGAVGADAAGDLAMESLEADGVRCAFVIRLQEAATGMALITVDDRGENQIAVAPGANLAIAPGSVTKAIARIKPQVVLAVLEIPMAVVLAAAEAAVTCGAHMVLNAAPGQPLPDALLAGGPVIVVNREELRIVAPAPAAVLQRGALAVLVTRGSEGLEIIASDGATSIAAERAGPAVDTTGAGDAFSGALAAFLADGLDLERAVRKANAAAALSVLREGARGGMSTRQELEDYLRRSSSVQAG
jgi:ribokinase